MALMLQVMAHPDRRDWTAVPHPPENFLDALHGDVAGLRIGFAATIEGVPVDPEVAALVERAAAAFEELGARVEPVVPPIEKVGDVFFKHWTVDRKSTRLNSSH